MATDGLEELRLQGTLPTPEMLGAIIAQQNYHITRLHSCKACYIIILLHEDPIQAYPVDLPRDSLGRLTSSHRLNLHPSLQTHYVD